MYQEGGFGVSESSMFAAANAGGVPDIHIPPFSSSLTESSYGLYRRHTPSGSLAIEEAGAELGARGGRC